VLTLKSLKTFSKYLWNNNSTNSSISISSPGKYWLEVTNQQACTGRDTIVIAAKDCMKGLYVPNGFTPNNDGKNDVFKAMLFGPYKSFIFTIYNRWGAVVFSTTDPTRGWDG